MANAILNDLLQWWQILLLQHDDGFREVSLKLQMSERNRTPSLPFPIWYNVGYWIGTSVNEVPLWAILFVASLLGNSALRTVWKAHYGGRGQREQYVIVINSTKTTESCSEKSSIEFILSSAWHSQLRYWGGVASLEITRLVCDHIAHWERVLVTQ